MSRSPDLIGIAALAGAAGLGYLIWKNGSTLKSAADAVGSGIKSVGNSTADVVKISADDPAVNVQTAGKIITPWGFLGSLVGTQLDKAATSNDTIEETPEGAGKVLEHLTGITTPSITDVFGFKAENEAGSVTIKNSDPVVSTNAAAAATPIQPDTAIIAQPVYSSQTEKILAEMKPETLQYLTDPKPMEQQDPEKEKKLNAILPKALRKAGTAGIITALRKGLI